MPDVILRELGCRRPRGGTLDGVDLHVRDGEVLAIVGPDDKGKTLLLDVIAGTQVPASGRVLVGASPPQTIPVFRAEGAQTPTAPTVRTALNAVQSSPPALADVAAAFDLHLDDAVPSLAPDALRRLQLAIHALAGAVVLLLDQPASGLEPLARLRTIDVLAVALGRLHTTTVYAAEDADEALRVGQRLAYLSDGCLVQAGTPGQLLAEPRRLEVARYLAGDRLPERRARLSEKSIVLPEGEIARPDHLPALAPDHQPVVYAAWPKRRHAGHDIRHRSVRGRPPLLVGAAANPALVFDSDTGKRLDRGRRRATRSVNVTLSDARSRMLADDATLATEGRYRVVVWIGASDERSIVANASEHAFPDVLLPPSLAGHELRVTAHGDGVEIPRAWRALRLPAYGDSRRMAFTFLTPADPGSGTIRLAFSYRQHVLQSVLVELSWGAGSRPPRARVDYTLSNLDDPARLPARDLALVVNQASPGQHRIIVDGCEDASFGVTVYEEQMIRRLTAARQALLDAHRDPKTDSSRYDAGNAKGRDAFIADLTSLAHRGASLLDVIVPNVRKRNRLVRRLRETAEQRNGEAGIQIAYAVGSRMDFPWHLVYDIGLGVMTASVERPCRVLERWDPHADPADLPALCPYRAKHTVNTICPYGFWGFAHVVEIPPSTADPSDDLTLCVRQGGLRRKMIVGLGHQLDADMSERHVSRLPAHVERQECDSRALLQAALAEPERELIYFYCHGRRAYTAHYGEETPLLELGTQDYVAGGDVTSWASLDGGWPDDHWGSTRPLVIINGCHTAEVTPVQAADFVSAFIGVGAAGVVGTEIMISQRVASEVGELLLAALLRPGATVGGALRSMRRALLAKGNVMGLAYSAYCSADLALSCSD